MSDNTMRTFSVHYDAGGNFPLNRVKVDAVYYAKGKDTSLIEFKDDAGAVVFAVQEARIVHIGRVKEEKPAASAIAAAEYRLQAAQQAHASSEVHHVTAITEAQEELARLQGDSMWLVLGEDCKACGAERGRRHQINCALLDGDSVNNNK